MNEKDFFNAMEEKIRQMFPDFNLEIKEIKKDKVLHGIILTKENQKATPVFYLEDFYEAYLDGMTIDELSKKFAELYCDALDSAPITEELIKDLKSNIVLRLIDTKRNKAKLERAVHEELNNGFSMVVCAEAEDYGFVLQPGMIKDLDTERIIKTAMVNTLIKQKPVFIPMIDIGMHRSSYNPYEISAVEKAEMYILSTENGNNGAIALMYPNMMNRVSELVGGDYYVIPSSIHETIIVPANTKADTNQLKQAIKDVNKSMSYAEVLNDNLYHYSYINNELRKEKL